MDDPVADEPPTVSGTAKVYGPSGLRLTFPAFLAAEAAKAAESGETPTAEEFAAMPCVDYSNGVSGLPFDGWTDYPFEELGDEPHSAGPIRAVRVTGFDGNKYATVEVGGITAEMKIGYVRRR